MNQSYEAEGLPRKDLRDQEKQAFRNDAQDGITEFLAGVLFIFVGRAATAPHLGWMLGLVCLLMGVAVFLQFLRAHPVRQAGDSHDQA